MSSLLLILFIFRLVSSKNSQSYGSTIDELWDSCHKLQLPLPQREAATPSSFCEARKKLDEKVFRDINQRIIETYEPEPDAQYRWLGHRLFAVDGSKINLPRSFLKLDYPLPSTSANRPQGLLSCLYQLKSKIPFDFELTKHHDERLASERHLLALKEDDVVAYDRGYFSYACCIDIILLESTPFFVFRNVVSR